MLETLWTDLKNTPTRIRDRQQALVGRARHRAYVARTNGHERFWTLRTTALEEVEGWLEHTAEVPVLHRVTTPVEKLVHERLEADLALPLEGYAAMNAKTAIQAVRGLDHLDLLRVRRHEAENKVRKTVLAAIDGELEHLLDPPEGAAA